MSQKFCSSCGAVTVEASRYCRHCGALLRHATQGNLGGATVSPLAATVPLVEREQAAGEADRDERGARKFHDTHESKQDGDRHTFDLEAQLAQGQPFLADEYGHVVTTPEHDPDLDEFLATPDFVAPDTESEETLVRLPARRSTDAAHSFPPPHAAGVSSVPTASVGSVKPAPANSQAIERRALRVWLGAGLSILIALGVGSSLLAAWYLTRSRNSATTVSGETIPVSAPAPAPQPDAQAKLNEADQLIAAGDTSAAIGRLREAVALDATNAEAHRRLARLLLAHGAHGEAITEFQAVVKLEPNDAESWRQLAAAQFAEGLYREAADSYERLLAITGEPTADENTQLAYADALRLAGRPAQARVVYQRLASSAAAEIARASRQRLAQLDLAETTTDKRADKTKREEQAANETPAPQTPAPITPAPVATRQPPPAPAETSKQVPKPPDAAGHYQRGLTLWPQNRAASLAEFRAAAAAGSPDAYYYLGLGMAEGREPKKLSRAELVAALNYFQRARGSRFSDKARRYEDQLGKEYDKRRK
ncbi:MAG: tetratricopeptide repeat protein [Acidobacteriota bacterium]|nr:tetratricopeptide repeat protein [Acidobacteriota bacterium]